MTRLEFPEPTPETQKKADRLVFEERPQVKKRLFEDTPPDPFKALVDEVQSLNPNFTGQQLLYAGNLIKQLTPLKEEVLKQFGANAQDAQAEFITKLADHNKKMELGEVAKLIEKAMESANKPKTFFSKLTHQHDIDWDGYRALATLLQTNILTMKSSMMFMSTELNLQKDRLPVHLAALSVVLDKNPPTDQDLLQLADSRRRALTFGVQQAMILHNQVRQMNVSIATMEENLNTFVRVTLPALELKASLE